MELQSDCSLARRAGIELLARVAEAKTELKLSVWNVTLMLFCGSWKWRKLFRATMLIIFASSFRFSLKNNCVNSDVMTKAIPDFSQSVCSERLMDAATQSFFMQIR